MRDSDARVLHGKPDGHTFVVAGKDVNAQVDAAPFGASSARFSNYHGGESRSMVIVERLRIAGFCHLTLVNAPGYDGDNSMKIW